MEGLGVIFFVIFAILAAISKAGKAGQGTGAPRPGSRFPQRPGQLPGRPGTPDVPMPQAGSRASAEAQRAADLVPDDLWAILTGERRPMRVPQRPLETAHEMTLPAPEPRRSVMEPVSLGQQGMAERQREEQELLVRKRSDLAEAMAAEAARSRPLEVAATPAGVVPAPAGQAPAAAQPAQAPAPRKTSRGLLAGPSDLRRAMVLRTVLGPPKALE